MAASTINPLAWLKARFDARGDDDIRIELTRFDQRMLEAERALVAGEIRLSRLEDRAGIVHDDV